MRALLDSPVWRARTRATRSRSRSSRLKATLALLDMGYEDIIPDPDARSASVQDPVTGTRAISLRRAAVPRGECGCGTALAAGTRSGWNVHERSEQARRA